MNFLSSAPQFLFFTGKGGVGKTSLSCAAALQLTEGGRAVLLVSTDPASNIGQVFDHEIGNVITPIAGANGLSALEIDPQAAAQQYRSRLIEPVRGVLPDDLVKGMEEQLSGACTTEIASFDEFTALLTDRELAARFDHIIFDTAPTGHTIRLLKLPGAWTGFLEAGQGDASCLGPLAGLEKQRSQYSDAVRALSDPDRTRLVLVSRAQKTALEEAARTQEELGALGVTARHLVINGVLPEDQVLGDTVASAIHAREETAITSMPVALVGLKIDTVPLRPFNMVGVAALQNLLDTSPSASQPPLPAGAEVEVESLPTMANLVDDIASGGPSLIMLMGKGGVGKTTSAAAIAVSLASRGLPVHLTTTDPAAHLTETLNGALDGLEVSRIDPKVETRRYQDHVLATKGKQLDAQGRAMLEEDLRSPCTEEIAVFQAFARIIREAGRKFVIMDTAPTGHTLLLLDATGAYHHEVMRHMTGSEHFTTPLMQLQNQQRTKVVIVTLAETTPVLEAASLQEDLRRAGIEPWAWLINNSLAASSTHSPLLTLRALEELPQIEQVRAHHAKRVALIPVQAAEPTGVERLAALGETRVKTKVIGDAVGTT